MKVRVLLVVGVLCAIAGCRSAVMRPLATNPNAPKIEVFKDADGRITADPEIALAYRKDGSGRAVKVKWETKNSADTLDIIFTETGCVEPTSKGCSGNKCKYETLITVSGDDLCRYTIVLNGRTEDPILVIDDNG